MNHSLQNQKAKKNENGRKRKRKFCQNAARIYRNIYIFASNKNKKVNYQKLVQF